MNKQQRHEAIRERAAEALRDMYHNATPRYPSLDDEQAEQFQVWFEESATFEVEYIQDGGAYGNNYRKTLAADCNAGKYKSQRARDYYIAKGMRGMQAERSRCNRLDSRQENTNAMWEYIGNYGKVYSWGRGGRTLAPGDLIKTRGGSSFSIRESIADEMPVSEVVTLIRVVESFNRFVGAWCDDVPNMWNEYYQDEYGGADIDNVAELSETD